MSCFFKFTSALAIAVALTATNVSRADSLSLSLFPPSVIQDEELDEFERRVATLEAEVRESQAELARILTRWHASVPVQIAQQRAILADCYKAIVCNDQDRDTIQENIRLLETQCTDACRAASGPENLSLVSTSTGDTQGIEVRTFD